MELRRSFRGSLAILPTLPATQDGAPVAVDCTLTASFHQP